MRDFVPAPEPFRPVGQPGNNGLDRYLQCTSSDPLRQVGSSWDEQSVVDLLQAARCMIPGAHFKASTPWTTR